MNGRMMEVDYEKASTGSVTPCQRELSALESAIIDNREAVMEMARRLEPVLSIERPCDIASDEKEAPDGDSELVVHLRRLDRDVRMTTRVISGILGRLQV